MYWYTEDLLGQGASNAQKEKDIQSMDTGSPTWAETQLISK